MTGCVCEPGVAIPVPHSPEDCRTNDTWDEHVTPHRAEAVRRNGPGAVWFAVCPDGCNLPQVHSKEQAQVAAMKHRIASAVEELRCHCWHGDEFDPTGPCPKCRIQEALGAA